MFEKHGYKPEFHESAGAHTWTNWRDYLNEFAPQLFQRLSDGSDTIQVYVSRTGAHRHRFARS
jgi:hypothetical protein